MARLWGPSSVSWRLSRIRQSIPSTVLFLDPLLPPVSRCSGPAILEHLGTNHHPLDNNDHSSRTNSVFWRMSLCWRRNCNLRRIQASLSVISATAPDFVLTSLPRPYRTIPAGMLQAYQVWLPAQHTLRPYRMIPYQQECYWLIKSDCLLSTRCVLIEWYHTNSNATGL